MRSRGSIFLIFFAVMLLFTAVAYWLNKSRFNPNPKYTLGQPLDSLNGVVVYYNGMVGHSDGRNTAPDEYNIGMKYQCVEFVKRYYYQHLGHKMPDAYGNAKNFFDPSLPDSTFNTRRGLLQCRNLSKLKPQPDDLLIFNGHPGNLYGHVAIVAAVTDSTVIIVQQNPGPFASSRDTFRLRQVQRRWKIEKERTLGWLRKVSDTAFSHVQL